MILHEKTIHGQRGLEYHAQRWHLRISEERSFSQLLTLSRNRDEGALPIILVFSPPMEGYEGSVYLCAPQSGAPDFYWPPAPKNKR
jgi:hypothetical protein